MAQKRDYAQFGGGDGAAAASSSSSSSSRPRQLEPAAAAAAAAAAAPERVQQLTMNGFGRLDRDSTAAVMSFMDNESLLRAMQTATFQHRVAVTQRHAHEGRVVWKADHIAVERMLQERRANPGRRSMGALTALGAKVYAIFRTGDNNNAAARRQTLLQLTAFARIIHEYDELSFFLSEQRYQPAGGRGIPVDALERGRHSALLSILDPPGTLCDWADMGGREIISFPADLPDLKVHTLHLHLDTKTWFGGHGRSIDFLQHRNAPRLHTVKITAYYGMTELFYTFSRLFVHNIYGRWPSALRLLQIDLRPSAGAVHEPDLNTYMPRLLATLYSAFGPVAIERVRVLLADFPSNPAVLASRIEGNRTYTWDAATSTMTITSQPGGGRGDILPFIDIDAVPMHVEIVVEPEEEEEEEEDV